MRSDRVRGRGTTRLGIVVFIALIAILAAVGVATVKLVRLVVGGIEAPAEQYSYRSAQAPKSLPYARIALPRNAIVYLEFRGAEVRAAMSVAGLKKAAPVRLRGTYLESPFFALPVPADHLPEGVSAVKASFMYGGARAILGTCRMDDRKTEWQCDVPFWLPTGNVPESVEAIPWPDLGKLTLEINASSSGGQLGVGVKLPMERAGLATADIRRNGTPAAVQVRVFDATGAEKASKIGPLTDFGFS